MTVQVALVHLEQGDAVEGGLDVMAVGLTGCVGEAQAGGHADAHEAQRAAPADNGGGVDGDLIAISEAQVALYRGG